MLQEKNQTEVEWGKVFVFAKENEGHYKFENHTTR